MQHGFFGEGVGGSVCVREREKGIFISFGFWVLGVDR